MCDKIFRSTPQRPPVVFLDKLTSRSWDRGSKSGPTLNTLYRPILSSSPDATFPGSNTTCGGRSQFAYLGITISNLLLWASVVLLLLPALLVLNSDGNILVILRSPQLPSLIATGARRLLRLLSFRSVLIHLAVTYFLL